MLQEKVDIYIIIVTYNGLKWIDKCLGSLNNLCLNSRIIVVDNNSTDNTISYIKENYSDVILIQSLENKGFGHANNIGLKYAIDNGADYVYLMNQDAWVEPFTIEGLISLMEKYPEYGIISPVQYDGDGDEPDSGFQSLLFKFFQNSVFSKVDFNEEIYSLDFVMAAHWLVRVKALKEVGYFLALFRHYGEDINLANRMIYHGWKVGFSPLYRGFHDRKNRESSEVQKLDIQYAIYLAHSANINYCGILVIKHFYLFMKSLVRIKTSLSIKKIYFCRVLGSFISIFKYRKQTKRIINY